MKINGSETAISSWLSILSKGLIHIYIGKSFRILDPCREYNPAKGFAAREDQTLGIKLSNP